jgi:hypothetical protein
MLNYRLATGGVRMGDEVESLVINGAFSDLDDLVRHWALPTERARMQKRLQSSMPELRELYERVMPRLEAIIQYLNTFPIGAIPETDRALEFLAYATVEASLAVERFGQPAVPDSFDALRFVPLHE